MRKQGENGNRIVAFIDPTVWKSAEQQQHCSARETKRAKRFPASFRCKSGLVLLLQGVPLSRTVHDGTPASSNAVSTSEIPSAALQEMHADSV